MRVRADNIDEATDEVIKFLKGASTGGVIYFHGFFGWGASNILKAIVKRLKESSSSLGGTTTRMKSGWDKIIHIDCSLWKSKRVLQKVIADELKLPQQVMAIFDQHDEEDDFEGVEQSSRDVIPYVKWEILKALYNHKFLVVFHNGSGSYIDLWECGVPVIGSVSGSVLWTSRGRFHLHVTESGGDSDMQKLAGPSDVALSFVLSSRDDEVLQPKFKKLFYEEAEEVARYTGLPKPVMSSTIVLECLLYRALRGNDCSIDWATHASNYWVCDGIIEAIIDGYERAWEIANVLQTNMNLDLLKCCMNLICDCGKEWMLRDRWVSANDLKAAAIQVPLEATSFFYTATRSSGNKTDTLALKASMFGPSYRSRLRVLHLFECAFSFSSPPFLCCSNLRFLLLDHCKDTDAVDYRGEEKHHSNNIRNNGACFWKLWVLDLRHTDWYWLLSEEMMDEMEELRELNVKGVTNWTISHLYHCSGARKRCRLRKLHVTTEPANIGVGSDTGQASQVAVLFPDLSHWSNLTTIILNGCDGLEKIGANVLPKSLQSFSFASSTNTKVKSISFRGCSRLESLLLTGLFQSLLELDMSGTALKTLNLSLVQAPHLRRLFLLACGNLCAILWPQEGKRIELEVVRIDTTATILAREEKETKEASHSTSVGSSSPTVLGGNQTLDEMDSYISLRDARPLRSVRHVGLVKSLSVDISSASSTAAGGHKSTDQETNRNAGRTEQVQSQNLYVDVVATINDNSSEAVGAYRAVGDTPTKLMCPCPPIPTDPNWAHCYIIIQDEKQIKVPRGTTSSEQETRATILPNFVHDRAKTLQVHDCLAINCIPGPAPAAVDMDWNNLLWCRLERCPSLEGTVFFTPPLQIEDKSIFRCLETFWASELLKARYIWDWGTSWFRPGWKSFEDLKFLHLDFCPRIVHVLPLYTSNDRGCRSLEVLEIVCCGNLREVFPSDSELLHEEPREFPNLKHIHLYELPMVQKICGRRMSAPNLETVKIRGCWGLRSLPAVRNRSSGAPPPKVDCEKDWWDGLEWDGEESGHHPSLYKPSYSKYHKKILLRRTVLR